MVLYACGRLGTQVCCNSCMHAVAATAGSDRRGVALGMPAFKKGRPLLSIVQKDKLQALLPRAHVQRDKLAD